MSKSALKGNRTPQILPNGVHSSGWRMEPVDISALAAALRTRSGEIADVGRARGIGPDFDQQDLSQSGWGLIVPEGRSGTVRRSLGRLLEMRADQAKGLFKVMEAQPYWSADDFLTHYGEAPTGFNPRRVPYHLLILADANEIPFAFQHQLGVRFSVGRLPWTAGVDLLSYCESVVAVEEDAAASPSVTLLSVVNEGDELTPLCHRTLVAELGRSLLEKPGLRRDQLLQVPIRRTGKRDVEALFAQPCGSPRVLLAVGHGAWFDRNDPRQISQQGALVCRDWRIDQPLEPAHCFGARDLHSDASLKRTIVVLVTCFGGGTDREDPFLASSRRDAHLTDQPFTAALPRKLLALGAPAVISHVGRAFEHSFWWRGMPSIRNFHDCLFRLASGSRTGAAMASFGLRYAELATRLVGGLVGETISDQDLAYFWTAVYDARAYVVLGDPAARLSIR